MVSQKDTFRSAQLLIKQFGEEAEERAHQMMMKFIKADDAKGAAAWLDIGSAIEDLKARKRQKRLH